MRSYPTSAFEYASVILESSCMGLYILPKYRMKTTSEPGERAAKNQAGAEPQHQTGADCDNDVHNGRKLCLQTARPQADFNALQAFFLKPPALVVLACKCFYHPNRGKN